RCQGRWVPVWGDASSFQRGCRRYTGLERDGEVEIPLSMNLLAPPNGCRSRGLTDRAQAASVRHLQAHVSQRHDLRPGPGPLGGTSIVTTTMPSSMGVVEEPEGDAT